MAWWKSDLSSSIPIISTYSRRGRRMEQRGGYSSGNSLLLPIVCSSPDNRSKTLSKISCFFLLQSASEFGLMPGVGVGGGSRASDDFLRWCRKCPIGRPSLFLFLGPGLVLGLCMFSFSIFWHCLRVSFLFRASFSYLSILSLNEALPTICLETSLMAGWWVYSTRIYLAMRA